MENTCFVALDPVCFVCTFCFAFHIGVNVDSFCYCADAGHGYVRWSGGGGGWGGGSIGVDLKFAPDKYSRVKLGFLKHLMRQFFPLVLHNR